MRFSLEASRMALDANAPEEVLRVVDVALPSAAGPSQRVKLLEARDRAFEMLRRPADRLQGLAELSALAEALGDTELELDVRRRAASFRMLEDEQVAVALAREVRDSPPRAATSHRSSPRASSSARSRCRARSARGIRRRTRPTSTAPRRRTAAPSSLARARR